MQFVHKNYAHCALIGKEYVTKMKSTESNMSYDDEFFCSIFSTERSKNECLNTRMKSQLCPVKIEKLSPHFPVGSHVAKANTAYHG